MGPPHDARPADFSTFDDADMLAKIKGPHRPGETRRATTQYAEIKDIGNSLSHNPLLVTNRLPA